MFSVSKHQSECDFLAEPLAKKSLPSHKVQEVNFFGLCPRHKFANLPLAKKSLPSYEVQEADYLLYRQNIFFEVDYRLGLRGF